MNPRKRKIEQQNHGSDHNHRPGKHFREDNITDEGSSCIKNHKKKTKRPPRDDKQNMEVSSKYYAGDATNSKNLSVISEADKKKHEAEMKRLEAMKKKRQEFKEKKIIIKSGLTGIVSIL